MDFCKSSIGCWLTLTKSLVHIPLREPPPACSELRTIQAHASRKHEQEDRDDWQGFHGRAFVGAPANAPAHMRIAMPMSIGLPA
jgi:hypothetical protein